MKAALSFHLLASLSAVIAYPILETIDSKLLEPRQDASVKAISVPFTQKRWAHIQMPDGLNKRQGSPAQDPDAELLNWEDTRYIATVTLAGQDMDLVLDTGSSDTWVFSTTPRTMQGIDPSLLPPLFDNNTAVGVVNTGLTYYARYGGGNGFVTTHGAIQFADLALVGTDLNIVRQPFANIYDATTGIGASGLLGLGHPLLSSIWSAAGPRRGQETGVYPTLQETSAYFPLVLQLQQQGEISEALFVIDIDRIGPAAQPQQTYNFNYTRDQGTLTIGGYPNGLQESNFVWSTVPFVSFNDLAISRGYPASTPFRWTADLQAIYFNGARLPDTRQQPNITDDEGRLYALIDSGNPTMVLPEDTMAYITNAWSNNPQNVVIPCDSRFELTYQFGGQNFTMDPVDILVPWYEAIDSLNYGGRPRSGCQFQAQIEEPSPDQFGPGTSVTYALGAPFMRNVISAFTYGDVRNAEINPSRIGFIQKPASA